MLVAISAALAAEPADEPWEFDWILSRVSYDRVGLELEPAPLELLVESRVALGQAREIYDRDQAAWHSSDVLVEAGINDLSGWITGEWREDRVGIHWLRDTEAGPMSVFFAEYSTADGSIRWPDPGRSLDAPSQPKPLPAGLNERWKCRQGAVAALGQQIPRFTKSSPNFVVTARDGAPYIYVMPPVWEEGEWLFGATTAWICPKGGEPRAEPLSGILLGIPEASEHQPYIHQLGSSEIPQPHWSFQSRHSKRAVLVRAGQSIWQVEGPEQRWLGRIPRTEAQARREIRKADKKRDRVIRRGAKGASSAPSPADSPADPAP